MVDFVVAGLSANSVPYLTALDQQRDIHAAVVSGLRADTVMLLEHPSVYTAGRRTEPHECPDDGSPVIAVDRGGKITWHGPGQLVGYPILALPSPIDVVAYVRRLEEFLISVLAALDIQSHQVKGRSGVWVDTLGHEAKIAAIGIRVADGVTMHGFALNCSNSFDAYERIVACGIPDVRTTSISALLERTVLPEDIIQLVQTKFTEMWERATV